MSMIGDLKKTITETITETIPSYFRPGSNKSVSSSTIVSSPSHLPVVHQEEPEEITHLRNVIDKLEAQLKQTKSDLSRVTKDSEKLSRRYSEVRSRCKELEATAKHFRDMATEERTAKENAVSLNSTLEGRLSAMRDELAKVRQELQGSRNFGSAETSDDGKTLIDAFAELNTLVDELCFTMAELLPETLLEIPFCGLQSTQPTLETLHPFFKNANNEGVLTPDVVQYTLQHVILICLFETVFRPFTPGLDIKTSSFLHTLHAGIFQRHPQAYSARWRSITYSEFGSRVEFAPTAHDLVDGLLSLIPLLCPQDSISPLKATEDLLHKAREVISAASTWQDKAKSSYTSWDYEAFVVSPGCPFDTKEMQFGLEPARKSRKTGVTPSGDVVATLRLGLRAWRMVQEEGGTYAKEVITPVPAAVLTSNWTSVNP